MSNDINFKFSQSRYLTKEEISKELRINLNDSMWSKIVEFRSNFAEKMPLKHIDDTEFTITYLPITNSKMSALESKINRLVCEYYKVYGTNLAEEVKKESYILALKEVSGFFNIDVSDEYLLKIINNELSSVPPQQLVLLNYFKCLKMLDELDTIEINSYLLENFYKILISDPEETNIYRSSEMDNRLNKFLVNKEYIGIHPSLIEKNMNVLYNFIKNSKYCCALKAASSYYYFNYIRPFETHSELINILLVKAIIAQQFGNVSLLINFESLLNLKDEFHKKFTETQKTYDMTYICHYFCEKGETFVNESLELLTYIKKNIIKKDLYRADKVESIIEDNTDIPVETPVEKPVVTENNNAQTNVQNIFNCQIAVNNIPSGLPEEEAKKLEKRLLEKDPDLTPSMAYFYARHCTLGMKYTINQFKKECSCAYETARTSMDKLAFAGYYIKEANKNKFIYIPVPKNFN